MSEAPIQPWFAVNGLMENTYRDIVVRIAMQHLSQASKDLQTFARQQFRSVAVRGFRSFDRADVKSAILAVIADMQKRQQVATAVMCLWGEAMQSSIATLQRAAESQGLGFQTEWDWHQAQVGYDSSEQVAALENVCDELVKGKDKPESDHLRLAVLWLSRAQLPATGESV
jgi:hypothetical protein